MRLTFCSSDASAAVMAVLTWWVSLIPLARSCPPRVRWKNASGSACRCSNRCTRRSRTTCSWMATLARAALYTSAFLTTNVASRTRTTWRSGAPGALAAGGGPPPVAGGGSTADPPVVGSASCPNKVRRNGMSSTNVTPSSTEAKTVVARLTTNKGVYGRSSSSSRVLRLISARSSRTPLSARPLPAAARREQRDRQDHFLRRHAAVQKRAAISGLILAQLGGIDEEAVRGREQEPHAETHARQAEGLQVLHDDRSLGILAAEIFAELVAQVGGRVALGVHRGGRLAVHRAVVRGEQHRYAPALGLAQRRQHRRALEPRAREAPQRGLVAGDLVQDRALGAPVRELVHEVEHQGRDAVLGEVRREAAHQVALPRAEQLLVPHRDGSPGELAQLLGQELTLVRVETLLIGRLSPPPGMPCRDLHWEHPGEDGVARDRRGGREDAVVMRLLDVEQRRHQIAQHLPLVEPQTVDHDEQRAPLGLEHRHQKLRSHVDRERRPVAFRGGEPAGILPGHVLGEVLAERALQRAQRLRQPGLVGGRQPHLPAGQLGHQPDPFAPSEGRATAPFELAG